MKKIILAMALAVAVVGCTTVQQKTVPVISFQKIEIPSQLLDCKNKKIAVPDPKKLTNKQVSQYILRSEELIKECQNDNASIDRLINEYNTEVDKINERLENAKDK